MSSKNNVNARPRTPSLSQTIFSCKIFCIFSTCSDCACIQCKLFLEFDLLSLPLCQWLCVHEIPDYTVFHLVIVATVIISIVIVIVACGLLFSFSDGEFHGFVAKVEQ